MQYDLSNQKFRDSLGSFTLSQLEKLDSKINTPLNIVTYGRDVTLRTDVTMGHTKASYTVSSFAAPGAYDGYISAADSTVTQVGVDLAKLDGPLNLWAKKASWTMDELASAMLLGQPLDEQKIEVINRLWQMAIDRAVYVGNSKLNTVGLFNSTAVSGGDATYGGWETATEAHIIADINEVLLRAQTASALAVTPTALRLSPDAMSILTSRLVSTAGNQSLATYVANNCISSQVNGKPLDIQQVKWLTAGQATDTDRMVAFTPDPTYVQFPVVPLQRQQLVYGDISQSCSFLGRIGQTELRYPETLAYSDFTL